MRVSPPELRDAKILIVDDDPDVVEAVIGTYLRERRGGERFIETARRLGPLPFRHAADAVRGSTALAA